MFTIPAEIHNFLNGEEWLRRLKRNYLKRLQIVDDIHVIIQVIIQTCMKMKCMKIKVNQKYQLYNCFSLFDVHFFYFLKFKGKWVNRLPPPFPPLHCHFSKCTKILICSALSTYILSLWQPACKQFGILYVLTFRITLVSM